MIRALRSLYERVHWVWQQDSAWADATAALALCVWSIIDLTAGPSVTDRPAFAAFAWLPAWCISVFTVTVTAGQVWALLARNLWGRIVASALQGIFWASVAVTLLGAPTGVQPLTSGAVVAIWAASWISLARVARQLAYDAARRRVVMGG